MAKARFIYDNLWRKGGNGIASTPIAEAQHPVSDTQIDTKSMFWRSSDRTVETQYIPMDLGDGTINIDFIAILGHNIPTGEGQNITVEEDDDPNFGSITAETDEFTWAKDNIFQFLATPLTERYIRVKLYKTGGGVFTTKPQIATIVCGKYFEPNCNFDWRYLEGDIDPSKISYSDSMVVFAQEKEEIFRGEYFFASLNDIAVASVQELITLCGAHKAFVICFDSANANTKSRWVRLLEVSQPTAVFHNIWSWDCPIEEVK